MPFHDLNLAYLQDHAALSNTLFFAKELDYETVALSIAITGDLPTPSPTIPISTIQKPQGLHLLTRLTLTISDTAHNFRLPTLTPQYDIIALRPTNEKALQHCSSGLECDLISFDFSQRLQFPLKIKAVSPALQRGVRFEICYSPGVVAGSDARRNLISGATQLIRATRGHGIVVSSEAKSALGLRGPWDLINLAQVWGLSPQRAKEAICEEAGKLVRLARIRRTSYRGVVDIIEGSAPTVVTEKAKDKPIKGGANSLATNSKTTNTGSVRQEKLTVANGTKRKVSTASLNSAPAQPTGEKLLSKSEMKRRAKKARLEGGKPSNDAMNASSSPFPLQHESLMPNKPK